MNNKCAGVVVSWGVHIQRSRSLAKELGYHDLHVLPYKWMSKNLVYKAFGYMHLFIKTFVYLVRNNYKSIVVSVPSVPPLYAVYLYSKLFKAHIVVDCHNGILRKEWRNWPFLHYIFQNVELCVTHNYLFDIEFKQEFGANSMVLGDPLVKDFDSNESGVIKIDRDSFNVFVPLSYAADEPVDELIQAAAKNKEDVTYYLTGNFNNWKSKNPKVIIPENVIPLGYISTIDYFTGMKQSDAILCLTSGEEIQMCASIESISLKKPLICSNTKFYKSFLNDDLFLCNNDSDDIARAVDHISKNIKLANVRINKFSESYSKLNAREILILKDILED